MTATNDELTPELAQLVARYRREHAPDGFSAQVMTQVARRTYETRRPLWRPVFAAAVMAALVIAIALPLLHNPAVPASARNGTDTQALATVSEMLAHSEVHRPDPVDLPDVMSVQSLTSIPDPLS
jgi:hypothetical protein